MSLDKETGISHYIHIQCPVRLTGGRFMIIVEERCLSDLEEMAGLRKPDTGLPVNLWLDETGAYKRSGHWKRIKFQGDHANAINPNNLFIMTISNDPQIMPPDAEVKIKLPRKEIEKVKIFVKNNVDLLSRLADQKITFAQFIKQMKI
jgi:hypothetical protein